MRRVLAQLCCALVGSGAVALACSSSDEKRSARATRGEGGSSAGAAGEPSTGGSAQAAGPGQGGSEAYEGGQPGRTGEGGSSAGSGADGSSGSGQSLGGSDGAGGNRNGGASGQAGDSGGGGAGLDIDCQEAAASVGASLLNGGFELPALPNPSWLVIAPGAEPADFGWSVLEDVDINHVGWSSGQGVLSAPAKDGIQYLDVVAFGANGALQQTVDVVPGASYVLALSYANNPITEPVQATFSATVSARVCDHTIFSETVSHTTSTKSDFDWTAFSKTFVAPAAIVTLEITETVGGGNGGIILDAVSLTLAPE
jgi:Protein of unknown function (DUF642)